MGRWADAQFSRGEVRARIKIGRIAGRIPSVFRHGSDENGVGWSDLDLLPSKHVVDKPLATLSRSESSIGADRLGRQFGMDEQSELVGQGADGADGADESIHIDVESAFLDALTARMLLICDVESTIAGQALGLRGDSLVIEDARERTGPASSPRRSSRRQG